MDTNEPKSTSNITRKHVHFTGFEPLDATAHHRRFEKGGISASTVWGSQFDVSPIDAETHKFSISGSGEDWNARTDILVVDLKQHVDSYLEEPFLQRIAYGYSAFAQVVLNGGLWGYFKHAWRFGIFAAMPFLLMLFAFVAALSLSWVLTFGQPLNYLWSLPVGILIFIYGYLPLSERFHTQVLFGDWRFALSMVKLNQADHNAWLESTAAAVKKHIEGDCDEILITTHSMGTSVAGHIIGALLEDDPTLFDGKTVTFTSLGGALLQCALLRSAKTLRERVGLIAQNKNIQWIEIQCLTDAVHFYKTNPFAILGFGDVSERVHICLIRFKHQLTPATYKRIKRDLLRVHRQYVMSAEKRYTYDFIPFIAGPHIGQSRIDRLANGLPAIGELDPD